MSNVMYSVQQESETYPENMKKIDVTTCCFYL